MAYNPNYDILMNDYEENGVIPFTRQFDCGEQMPTVWDECPYCLEAFAVGKNTPSSIIHCPYCCMEIRLARSKIMKQKTKKMTIKVYKEEWESTSDSFDNDGYVYGVSWYDENDNFLDVMWFKKEHKRDEFYYSMLSAKRGEK